MGKTRVTFSEKMETQYLNISHINSTMLDIYVKPSEDWHEYDESFKVNSTLNLTWKAESYQDNYLDLSLKFNNPL